MRKHLAISGELGTGKSTLSVLIGERLGLQVFSTGGFQRRMASSLGLSTLELNEAAMGRADVDRLVDGEAKKLASLADAPIVFDSRMAWHTVPDCFTVRLVADPRVSAERAFTRRHLTEEYDSIDQAEHRLLRRYSLERERFAGTYSVDITRLRNFDLVLDTSDIRPEEAADLVIERWRSDVGVIHVGIVPSRVVPLLDYPKGEQLWHGDFDSLPVGYCRPYFFAFDGRYMMHLAETDLARVVFTSNLVVEQDEVGPEGVTACNLLERYSSRDNMRSLLASGFALDSYFKARGWMS